jgi:hypothetical protein
VWARRNLRVLTLQPAVDFVPASSSARALIRAAANVLLVVLIALWISSLVLQTEIIRSSETVAGPFADEGIAGSQIKVLQLSHSAIVRCCVRARSDLESTSALRLSINGRALSPAHVLHQALREGAPGYSHWGNQVYFVLPPGVANSAQTLVRADYALQPARGRGTLLAVLVATLTYLLHCRRIGAWLKTDRIAPRLATTLPHTILFAFGWALLAAATVYISILLWGLLTGEALTLAIPFRPQTVQDVLEWLDPAIPLSLLLLAMTGVVVGWLAATSHHKRALQRADLSALRWIRRYGLAVLALFYLASVGASWAGSIRHGTTVAILGLIPYFDGASYFKDVNTFLRDGAWSDFTSRRPLAGAFRTTIFLLGDLRYAIAIALQTLAISAVVYFGTMAVMRWRGLWAGIAYLALSYILVRSHLSNTMTEPVALIVALGSIPFFIETLRRHSRLNGLIAVLLMSAAIWMRPGAMFLIPALPLWFGLYFGRSLFDKSKQFAIACSVALAMFAFDALLGRMFGSGSLGNFGETLCGLSIGDTWSACFARYPEEYALHNQGVAELQKWLYAKAIENIARDPRPILKIMILEPIHFITVTPRVMLIGNSYNMGIPGWFPTGLWLFSIVVFYLATIRHRMVRREALFWGVIALGVMASTTLFYFTDGIRAFSVIYPLIALFIALATFSPSSVTIGYQARTVKEFRVGRWSIAVIAVLLVSVPAAGRLFYRVEPVARASTPGSNENVAVVRGMSKSSGVLVVADGQPLPHGVPSIHFRDFAESVRDTGVEASQGIITPTIPQLPFGFVIMPRLDTPSSGAVTLITPPEMVLRREVCAWEVTYADWNPTGKLFSENWFFVTRATPYGRSGPPTSR